MASERKALVQRERSSRSQTSFSRPRVAGRWQGGRLWMYLLALGFDETPQRSICPRGPRMFHCTDRSVFQETMIFLFTKLDRTRAASLLALCRHPTDFKFRNECCKWLKEITNENGSCVPRVTSSSLVTCHDPKIVDLMYQLARYVLIKDMEKNFVGTDIPFAQALKRRPRDKHMAKARCTIAYNKLQQICQRKHFITQEHKKKAKLLIEEIKHLRSKYAVLQMQFNLLKQNEQTKPNKTERIEKVRSMWSFITETLTSLKKEKEAVDSVISTIRGSGSQCVLDGTKVVPHVPQILMKSDIHQYCTGNMYEGENLNFLTVIQLLNAALRVLRDECGAHLSTQLQVPVSMVNSCKQMLQRLQSMSLNIQQQHCVTSRSSSGKQEDWKVKWKSFLDLCPFNSVLSRDSSCHLLRALPFPTSHFPEEEHESTSCQGLASISDYFASIQEVPYEKDDGVLKTTVDNSTSLWMSSISSAHAELLQPSGNRHVLLEKDLPVFPKILKNGKDERIISVMTKNASAQTQDSVKKEDHLQKSRDEVVELIAEAVTSETPQCAEGKEITFEDLISSLQADPFITRKQIPRTPENLLTEIRSSRRKAVESEDSSNLEMPPTEVLRDNAQVDARPIMQEAGNSTFTSSVPASSVCDIDSSFSKRKSEFSSMKQIPQGRVRVSAVLETCETQERERTEPQKLNDIALNRSVEDPEHSFQYVQKCLNDPDTCSENNSKTNVLFPDSFGGSLMHASLCWPISSLSSVNTEAGYLGILEETLPESDSTCLSMLETSDSSENEEDMKKLKSDLQSLSNKMSASRSEEELYQIHDGGEPVSCRSDYSHAPEKRESDELFSPLQLICLDEECNEPLLPTSDNGRKYSLSSVLASCQRMKEMASMVYDIPPHLIDKFKEKEQQNEKLDTMSGTGVRKEFVKQKQPY